MGGNISARDGSTRSWEECAAAAAAAMNRGLVGVERGAGRCLVWAILDWSKLSPAQELRAEPARLSF